MNSRLLSLDFFRGLTIAAMIVVNDPGSWSYIYAPLKHADWHGATPTDLVFPFFLFIVGISISLSLSKREISDNLYFKIVKRSIIIFLLGIFLALFPSIGSYYCWAGAVSIIGANRAGIFLSLIPLFSTIMAIFFYKEQFQFFHLIGAILIILGLFLSNKEIKNA